MFGLNRKALARGDVSLRDAGWKLANVGVHIRLTNEVSVLMGTLLEDANISDEEAGARLQNCIDLQEGIDACLVKNLAPFSFQVPDKGQIRVGALLALRCRNSVLISGTFDFPKAQADIQAAMCAKR
jgi:hypothetical protein